VNGDLPRELAEPSEQPPTSSMGSETQHWQLAKKFISPHSFRLSLVDLTGMTTIQMAH
jgi:hypothetical protein